MNKLLWLLALALTVTWHAASAQSVGQTGIPAAPTVSQGGAPWSQNITQLNGVALGSPSNYGTSPGAVSVHGVNAFVTNTPPVSQSGTWTVQPGNTANSTPWLVTVSPATSGGMSIATGSIGATKTAIKASAGQVYCWSIDNPNTAIAYVQFFNLASASVTLGTTAPTFSLGIPGSGGSNFCTDEGIAMGTAITIAVTTTRAGSTGPTSTVDYNIFYN